MMLKAADRVAKDEAITIPRIEAAFLDDSLASADVKSKPIPFLVYRSKRICKIAHALRKAA
ncbi:hypothetical protein [Rhizobium sp. AG207R]|uniref:hypothetical protein n=1 Tax=Rhizobium sp. AG207R TaxID=2802287 RepID=UPI0013B018B9|nr:hypothetical protein [Rhizobium sp. AG207R]MCZ3378214.1 hypothetical protein [Rhizobium sp. AG207R]